MKWNLETGLERWDLRRWKERVLEETDDGRGVRGRGERGEIYLWNGGEKYTYGKEGRNIFMERIRVRMCVWALGYWSGRVVRSENWGSHIRRIYHIFGARLYAFVTSLCLGRIVRFLDQTLLDNSRVDGFR